MADKLADLFSKQIGNGLKTHFWAEPWKDPRTLADRLPRLFALENVKQAEEIEQLREAIRECSLNDKPNIRSLRCLIKKALLGVGDKETSWNEMVPSRINIFMWWVIWTDS
ncbi:hypothetical protein OSB04_018527 [Centaurea solstitialis]|uniref:Uncharacterized protein n=1 Tax=Centaurea solstitialis TaxID=347529 RepID=A0AA38WAL0_9ASTR|nr:hypothetical protein OSB04_018527 [Centaurea solstitialis]